VLQKQIGDDILLENTKYGRDLDAKKMEMRSIFRSMSQEEKNEWVGADEDDST
jgi:hypothetical protein